MTSAIEKLERDMTPDEQLSEWVNGISIHNSGRDECCPDFSCCEPSLLAPKAVRVAFKNADEKTRFGMLGFFLGASFQALGAPKVYVAGQGVEL